MKQDYLELIKKANKTEGNETVSILKDILLELKKNNELISAALNANEIEIETTEVDDGTNTEIHSS